MFIKANHFDYDKLLGGIVEHLDLKDEHPDDQMVSDLFKNFESTYKRLRIDQKLEDWQEELVVEFLSSVQTSVMYNGQYQLDDESLGEDQSYHAILARIMDSLVDCITGTNDDTLSAYLDGFIDRIAYDHISHLCTMNREGKFILANGATLEPEQFANFLKSWVESHLSNELDGINGFLFEEINNNVLPQEYMKDINVMDIPGSKAKHGDTLITFPLILLEVHNR